MSAGDSPTSASYLIDALTQAAERLQSLADQEAECLRQGLGLTSALATLADGDPVVREQVAAVWSRFEGKKPRMDNHPSRVRHLVALVLLPQNPAAALKEADSYVAALRDLPPTLSPEEVAEQLRQRGIGARLQKTRRVRAGIKGQPPTALATGDGSGPEDPEPGTDQTVLALVTVAAPAARFYSQGLVGIIPAHPMDAKILDAMPRGGRILLVVTRDASDQLQFEAREPTGV